MSEYAWVKDAELSGEWFRASGYAGRSAVISKSSTGWSGTVVPAGEGFSSRNASRSPYFTSKASAIKWAERTMNAGRPKNWNVFQ